MTSIRPDGYCKECSGYTQAVCFDTSGLCAACEGNQEMIKLTQKEWLEQRAILLRQWVYWQEQIANGNTSSAPRDWFEKVLELFEPTEYLKEKYENERSR